MRRGRVRRWSLSLSMVCTFLLLALCLTSRGVVGQTNTAPKAPDPGLLTIDRLFHSGEFAERGYGGVQWADDGSSYLRLERSNGGSEIVRYDAATGARSVVVATDRLRREDNGAHRPLAVE